jgi:hypothetical protein
MNRTPMNLKSMSIDNLSKLGEQVEAALSLGPKSLRNAELSKPNSASWNGLQRADRGQEEVKAARGVQSLRNTAIRQIPARLGQDVGCNPDGSQPR